VLTLSTAFKEAFRVANPEPAYSVQVDIDGSTSFYMCSRPDSAISTTEGGAYTPIVASVTPIAIEIDPVKQGVKFGSRMDVVLTDEGAGGFLRNIISGNRAKNRRIIVKLGDVSNAIGEYASFWRGFIDDWIIDGPTVVLQCSDAWDQLESRKVSGTSYERKHPLEYAEDIIDSEGLSSELKNTTALDPDTYTSTMSHWATARTSSHGNSNRSPKGETAAQLLGEIAQILDGAFFVDEDGKITFTEFDASGAADVNWTDNDIRDFRQVSTSKHMINRLRFQFSTRSDGTHGGEIVHGNTDEQGNFPYPGESEGIFEEVLRSPWVGVGGSLNVKLEANGTSVEVAGGWTHSMTGMRNDGSSGWTLTSSRPAYLFIVGPDNTSLPATTSTEVIKCTTATPDTSWTVIDSTGTLSTYYNAAAFTVATSGRDMFNGGASTGRIFEKDSLITDITIPVEIAKKRIERLSQGMPVVTCSTSLHHYDVQVGDTVTITTDRFIGYGLDGLTTSQKWKVVRKEVHGSAINWKLAYGGNTTGYTEDWEPKDDPISVPIPPILPPDILGGGVLFDPKIVVKAENIASDLDIALGSGTLSGEFGTIFVQDLADVTLTASKDNYLYMDAMSGQINVRQQATSAGYPSVVPASHLPLAIAETDGTSVTALTDIRPPARVARPPGQTVTSLPDATQTDGGSQVEVDEVVYRRANLLLDELILDTDGGDEALLYWKLDESSGGTADNSASSGATYDGTFTNSPTLGATGIVPDDRTSMELNAATESCLLSGTGLTGATDVTVATWLKGEASSNLQHIWNIRDSASALDFSLISVSGLNTTMDFYVGGSKYDLTLYKEDFLTGSPVHVAATWSQSTEDLKIYIDGVLRDTVASVHSAGTLDFDDVYAGSNTLGFGTASRPGFFQNFAVWNSRVLTTAEIAAMAARGDGFHANWEPVTGLAATGAFQVGEFYRAYDLATAMSATSTTLVALDAATINRGLEFDAGAGRITVKDAGTYMIAGRLTVAGLLTTKHMDLHIYKNAAAWRTGDRFIGNASATVDTGGVLAIGKLAAGDIVDMRAYNSDSTARDLKGGVDLTRMSIWKLPTR